LLFAVPRFRGLHAKLALMGAMNRLDINDPPTSVGGIRVGAMAGWCRLDINDPPTSVGGIRVGAVADWCRLELNDPLTSVGGIWGEEDEWRLIANSIQCKTRPKGACR
jgi:hypothetical protein